MSDRVNTAYRWKGITPSDTNSIEPRPVSVYVGASGNVVAVGDDGHSEPFAAVAGTYLNIQPTKIMATGTTATGLVALYN